MNTSIEDMNLEEAREALKWLQDKIRTVSPGSEKEWNIIMHNARVSARIKSLESKTR